MLEMTLREYAEALSSKAPVPGGGGAAAYVGALGISLGSMVGNLTLGKKKYADVQDEVAALIVRSDALRDELEALSEADATAFEPLSRAYRLPSATPEEQQAKAAVLQPALAEAARVPLDICTTLVAAIDVLAQYARVGTVMAISDVGVGASLCRSALQSAELNVLINTRLLDDETLRAELEGAAAEAVASGCRQADEILAEVDARLRG